MDAIFYTIISYSVPVIVWIVWKRKADARTFPLIIGMASYMCISLLRGLARWVILTDSLRRDPWMFYIVSALLSGVFEEVGRYLVFCYVIPYYDRRDDCISYGIGHVTIEIILTQSFIKYDIIDSLLSCDDFVTGIAFSVAMSVFCFAAANYYNKKLLAVAIGLHTIIDIIPAFYFMEKITIGELMFLHPLYIAIVCFPAYLVYRTFREY